MDVQEQGDQSQASRGTAPTRAKLVDEVASLLRQRIYSGVYPPGELLRQVQLSRELNVSRTPLREALRTLQSEGLVAAQGTQGVGVPRADRGRLLNAYSLREMLDGLAARQAAQKAACRAHALLDPLLQKQLSTLSPWSPIDYVRFTMEFHVALVELADNEFLSAQMVIVRLTCTVFAPVALAGSQRARVAIEERRRLVEAIASGNAEEAECLGRSHIRRIISHLNEDAE